MNIASSFGQDKVTAFYMIDNPTCSLEGCYVFVATDSRKLLHMSTL